MLRLIVINIEKEFKHQLDDWSSVFRPNSINNNHNKNSDAIQIASPNNNNNNNNKYIAIDKFIIQQI